MIKTLEGRGKYSLEFVLAVSSLLLLFFLVFPARISAYSYSPVIEQVDAMVEIGKDGSVTVDQEMVFNSNSNYLFWIIPSKNATNISISQGGQMVMPSKIKKEGDRTIVFWLSQDSQDYYTQSKSSLSYQLPSDISLRSGKELINHIYLKEPGQMIEELNLSVTYPGEIVSSEQRYYGVHGVGEVEYSQENNRFDYQVSQISEYGIFSFDLVAPRGSFEQTFWEELKLSIGSLSLEVVLLISLVLPLIALFFLFSIYRNHIYTKDISNLKGYLDQPPSKLSPMEVDILRRGRLSQSGIGAQILSLLNRGYLTVVEKPDKTILGKIKEPNEEISEQDRMLINILFERKKLKGGLGEIEKKKRESLFDKLTDELFKKVNRKVFDMNLFVADQTKIKNRVLKQAILIFFVALLLAIFLLLFFPSSPWLAVAPVSMVFISLLIVRLRHFFTVRSPKGQDELVSWLKFKNYLKEEHPVTRADKATFLEYLPWAYLFSVSQSWTRKFNRYPIACPSWFASCTHGERIEDRIKKTTDLIDRISEEIVGLKSPLS